MSRTDLAEHPRVRPARLAGWAPLAARLVLAIVLGLAGLAKLRDLTAAGRTVALYRIGPAGLAPLIGGVLPFIEVALAVLLLAGLAVRAAAAATAGLLVVYVAAITSVWVRGMSIDCGCFGGGGAVSTGSAHGYAVDIMRDLVLVGVAGFLVLGPADRFAVDHWALEVKEH
jgi:uncharacterized membrane protein YphA (DoxX/SURF4 family)